MSSGITSGDTSLVVVSATGYPAAPFSVVLDQGQVTEEVVLVGAKSGTTFSTLTRGFDGTSAAAHSSGATCKHVLIAADLDDANSHRFSSPATAGDTDAAQASIHHTIDTVSPTTSAVADAATAGTALKAAARDHKHGREAFASPAASAPGDAQGAGSATTVPRSDHVHAREAFASPSITLGSSAGAGSAVTLIRSDAVIAAFDATSPSTQAVGDSAVVGTAAFAARRDHKHARENFATNTITLSTAAAAGSALTLVRSDAVIAAFDATAPVTQAFSDVAATGTAAFAARRDHKHGMPADPTAAADTAQDATGRTTTSATYVTNTGAPAVTVATGTLALVIIKTYADMDANTGYVAFAVSGATTRASSDNDAAICHTVTREYIESTTLLTTLTAGSNVFTVQVRRDTSGTLYYEKTRITVIPLN